MLINLLLWFEHPSVCVLMGSYHGDTHEAKNLDYQ